MPSLMAYLKETVRREITKDDKFYKSFLYFFELKVPVEISPLGSFLFPLVLNPESITLDEPFALETTQTQGGGVIVEENGIVIRRLNIRGHTGFKPRKLLGGSALTSLASIPASKRSYDRTLPGYVLAAISGQRHFQYLQDSVFRAYADLKRDPDTSQDTRLIFHNPKDDEHWEVVPQSFRLERSSAKPVSYQYAIELVVVGKASACEADFSEDKGWLDGLKSMLRTVNNAILLAQGAIRDLTAAVAEIKGFITNIATILTNAVGILNAASDFVNGVTDLIQTTKAAALNLVVECEQAWDNFEGSFDRLAASLGFPYTTGTIEDPLPAQVHQALKDIATAAELLLTQPMAFETPLQQQLRNLAKKQSLDTVASTDELAAAEAASSPTSLTEIAGKGTGLMPGDYERSLVKLTDAGGDVPGYTSLQEVVVEQGDTLMSLAAKYMGDARKWQELAVVNGLKPPFISGQAGSDITEATDQEALPGALGVGKKLLVPAYKIPPEAQPLLPVLGVSPEKSLEHRLLGGDLALIRYPGEEPRFDVEIDVGLGSVDAKKVIGLACLRQAIELRLVIEKGTDLLYKNVGLERVVGLNWAPLDRELIQYRVMKSIQEDPRILGVRKLVLTSQGEDDVEIEVEAVVAGFSQPATVKATI